MSSAGAALARLASAGIRIPTTAAPPRIRDTLRDATLSTLGLRASAGPRDKRASLHARRSRSRAPATWRSVPPWRARACAGRRAKSSLLRLLLLLVAHAIPAAVVELAV